MWVIFASIFAKIATNHKNTETNILIPTLVYMFKIVHNLKEGIEKQCFGSALIIWVFGTSISYESGSGADLNPVSGKLWTKFFGVKQNNFSFHHIFLTLNILCLKYYCIEGHNTVPVIFLFLQAFRLNCSSFFGLTFPLLDPHSQCGSRSRSTSNAGTDSDPKHWLQLLKYK
jgi:hypothetical protein